MRKKILLTYLIFIVGVFALHTTKVEAVDAGTVIGTVTDMASVPVNDSQLRQDVRLFRQKEIGTGGGTLDALKKLGGSFADIAKKLPSIDFPNLPIPKIGGIDIGSFASGIGDLFNGAKSSIPWDTITVQLARLATDKIFDDMTDWVNRGFQGNPAFAYDLNGWLKQSGDAVLGQALNEITNGFACQPFRLELRAAITRDFGVSNRGRYFQSACNLSDIEGNVQEFLNGDFGQGGWPAWFRLTQVDENNPYGEYLIGVNMVSLNIQGARDVELKRLDWSSGFKGTRQCTSYAPKRNPDVSDEQLQQCIEGRLSSNPDGDIGNIGEATNYCQNTLKYYIQDTTKCMNWVEVTPGHVLAEQVNKVFGAAIDQTQLADRFDEFLGAIVNQLSNRVFSNRGIIDLSPKHDGAASQHITGTIDYGSGSGSSSVVGDCSVDQSSVVVGDKVNWSVDFSSGNNSNAQFTWTGSDVPGGSVVTTEPTLAVTYNTPGTGKTMSVSVKYLEADISSFDPQTQTYTNSTEKTKQLSCAQTVRVSQWKPLTASCSPDKYVTNADKAGNYGATTNVVWTIYVQGGSGNYDRVYMRGDEDDVSPNTSYDDGLGRHLGVFLNSSNQVVLPFDRTNPVIYGKDGDKTLFKFIKVYTMKSEKEAKAYVIDKDQTVEPVIELQCDGKVLVQ